MRYKIMGFAMMALMFFCSFAATALDQDNSQNRIHQHRSYQLPETECTCDGMELCTHLPLIRIDTAGQYIPARSSLIRKTASPSSDTQPQNPAQARFW